MLNGSTSIDREHLRARMKCEPADVLFLTKSGLDQRVDELYSGQAPQEFFYGAIGLIEAGHDIRVLNTSDPYSGSFGHARRFVERVVGKLTGISTRRHYLEMRVGDLVQSGTAVSFTDHFSLSLGEFGLAHSKRPKLIGLFHGLSDFPNWLTPFGKRIFHGYAARRLRGLDLVGFFGPADKAHAEENYGLDPQQTCLIRFGVDTEFWCPTGDTARHNSPGKYVIAVGSDPSRDYPTLVDARLPCSVRLVTRLPVKIPEDCTNISLTQGSFWASDLSDVGLRRLYQEALAVVVPLHDVFQPTGYSVTLQAMACGKPVILSKIKGLWTPELLVDGENCLLVEPNDPQSIADAYRRIEQDTDFAARIGSAARETILNHFTLEDMERSILAAVNQVASVFKNEAPR